MHSDTMQVNKIHLKNASLKTSYQRAVGLLRESFFFGQARGPCPYDLGFSPLCFETGYRPLYPARALCDKFALASLRTGTGAYPYGLGFFPLCFETDYRPLYPFCAFCGFETGCTPLIAFHFARNRFASVRILSISIFIRTMPSQCV